MSDFLQLVFSGLAQGAIYGLVALGFVAVFSVREIVNLVQGEYAALAGLTAISVVGTGLPLFVAAAVAVVVVVLVAVALERLTIAPIKRMTPLLSIILTLGVSTAVKAAMLLIWGPEALRLEPFPGSDFTIGGVSIRAQELWILGTAAVLGFLVVRFYEHTLQGKALRACAEQPTAARLVGISPRTATMVAFAIAGLVGATAGVVGAPIYLASWTSGLTLGLKGFVAATLGGLVSFRVAMLGGLMLGVLENLVAGYVASGYRDAVAFVVLLLVLLIRPQGLALKASGVRV
ncbi:MAG TPA: branched-chain amino acid ABC transporter permease [Intrasporangium sp.]|uniref:branched-chain amino acid ABC transporter permease n=1 Tax=Intrasporangium sp. TaxID=1925024 RepID=UPI002B4A1670|nr:branched-chain amino acid ABC transporter permease [Intrasporangium sp.]HKX66137.1 branched-chain amino acid ABC transporter permease [Intrasporangium sp.]